MIFPFVIKQANAKSYSALDVIGSRIRDLEYTRSKRTLKVCRYQLVRGSIRSFQTFLHDNRRRIDVLFDGLMRQHRTTVDVDFITNRYIVTKHRHILKTGPFPSFETQESIMEACSETNPRASISLKNRTNRVENISKEHETKREHKPNTGADENCVYVLTMMLDQTFSNTMNLMRQQYFPRKLNKTPAHITLFHALPHSQLSAIKEDLAQITLQTEPFRVTTKEPFRMRKGIGVNVGVGVQHMKIVHEQLRSRWKHFLSDQDRYGFRPHWTVMNKVDDEQRVDQALKSIRTELSRDTKDGIALGLEMWMFEKGRWRWVNEYTFRKAKEA